MKKTPKKLQLCRETLRLLSAEQTKLAMGGISLTCPPPPTSDSVQYCCADE
jgi:hypothetical protein